MEEKFRGLEAFRGRENRGFREECWRNPNGIIKAVPIEKKKEKKRRKKDDL